MSLYLKKPVRRKYLPVITLGVVLVFLILLYPKAAMAFDWTDLIITPVSWLVSLIQWLLGLILAVFIDLLVKIASFNHFIDKDSPSAVDAGWRIMRDLANMMFVVIILIMAFGTILKLQTYHAKTMLGKFIIMVFLVNFSKTICGFFIDFAQIVMMTFVNAFSAHASLTMAIGLNLHNISRIAEGGRSATELFSILGAMLLGIALLVVALGVIIAMTVILLFRIVIIWILVILSPMAYVCQLLPQTKKYASQWWEMFGRYLIVGPVMAFFLWLALSIVAQTASQPINVDSGGAVVKPAPPSQSTGGTPSPSETPMGVTEITSSQNMFNYLITIALLMAGLQMTQQMGVMGGSIAGAVHSKLSSAGMKVLKSPLKMGAWGTRKFKAATGVDLNPASIYRTMKAGFEKKRMDEEREGMDKAGKMLGKGGIQGALGGLGAAGWVDSYAQGFMWRKGINPLGVGFKRDEETGKIRGLEITSKLWRGSKGKIDSIEKERLKQEEKLGEVQAEAGKLNPDEQYRGMLQEDKNEAEAKKAGIEAEIEAIEGIEKAPVAQMEKLTSDADFLSKKAQKDFDEGKISKSDKEKMEADAEGMKKRADEMKEKLDKYKDSDEYKKYQTRLEELKGTDGKGGKLKEANAKISGIEAEITGFDGLKNFKERDETARKKMVERADKKRQAAESLEAGRLSESQKQKKRDRVAEINMQLKLIDDDIKNKKALGVSTGNLTELRKELIQEWKDNGNAIAKDTATGEEKKENEEEANRLREEATNLDFEASLGVVDEADRTVAREEAAKIEAKIRQLDKKMQKEAAYSPIDFLAEQQRRAAAEEASRKYNTTNEDELIAYQGNAMARGNAIDMAAIAMQAARVGHLNELINVTRATKDYYVDPATGRITDKQIPGARKAFKKGDYLSAGVEGMHVYMKEVFQNKLKYGEQSSLALENDLSNIAEGINHWTFGQAVGTRADGTFFQRGFDEQNHRCYVERSKKDFEGLYRQGNRLSISTESWVDPHDHSKGRQSILNPYAMAELSEKWPKLMELAGRGRFNPNASEHLVMFNKPILNMLQQQAFSKGLGDKWTKFRSDLAALGGASREMANIGQEVARMHQVRMKLMGR